MKTNALKLHQSLGRVLERLKKTDEPVIIEKNREPVAVLISYKTFRERFVDLQERKKIGELVQRFEETSLKSDLNSTEILRQLRYGSSS